MITGDKFKRHGLSAGWFIPCRERAVFIRVHEAIPLEEEWLRRKNTHAVGPKPGGEGAVCAAAAAAAADVVRCSRHFTGKPIGFGGANKSPKPSLQPYPSAVLR